MTVRASVHAGLLAIICPALETERHDARTPDTGKDRGVTTQVTTQILATLPDCPLRLSRACREWSGPRARARPRSEKIQKKITVRESEHQPPLPVSERGVNLLHDPLGPLNTSGDQLVGSRASLRCPKQVVRCLHVQARQDRRHDPDHALSALIHRERLAYSPFVRLRRIRRYLSSRIRPEGCTIRPARIGGHLWRTQDTYMF
jgi:hypothetical protein